MSDSDQSSTEFNEIEQNRTAMTDQNAQNASIDAEIINANDELSTRQQLAMLVLISGGTQRTAAQAAGVSEFTVSRWVNTDADFKRLYAERKAGVWAAHEAKIAQLTTQALSMLGKLMGLADDPIRMEAIKVTLKLAGLLPTGTRVANFGQMNVADKQINITRDGE